MGLPLRTLCLLIPTRPLLWPCFTHLFMKSAPPPPTLLLGPLTSNQSEQPLPLCLHSSFVFSIHPPKTISERIWFVSEEGINPSAVLIFFFNAHYFWSSIWTNIKTFILAKPAWCGVCNFVCVQASLCVCKHVYSTDVAQKDRRGHFCSDSSQTIGMSVWMTWWAWNWLQLLCRNTHTHPQLLPPHKLCEKQKVKNLTSQYGKCVHINI